ncbi:hypothetical protein [Flectobacillus sp. BAB-3569]|jgi:hypothetical protein|uniref:hypothetical protein n=1 Tax=Flectobacillus sp. BAB-3569 TaxID=1509483 RepID=UPI000BA48AF9|nr:hypothetical protein [Flectobacillus sp. BAB-3569]PAC32596.1 hypothetical protein BWI92_05190 [Flectobacillus sp. BAB-3569]
MEPITTTAIASVVTYLAGKLKENQSVKSFLDDFTEATVNWIRPIFLKEDGTEEKIIQKLKENPDSATKQEAVKVAIVSEIEDNPAAEQFLLEMVKVIASKTGNTSTQTNTMTVTGDGNYSFQGISNSNINIGK